MVASKPFSANSSCATSMMAWRVRRFLRSRSPSACPVDTVPPTCAARAQLGRRSTSGGSSPAAPAPLGRPASRRRPRTADRPHSTVNPNVRFSRRFSTYADNRQMAQTDSFLTTLAEGHNSPRDSNDRPLTSVFAARRRHPVRV
ncbi:hypothetical protein FAIPA1_90158 [Frankia sp. AiPs1]